MVFLIMNGVGQLHTSKLQVARTGRPGTARPRAWPGPGRAGPAAAWYFVCIFDILDIFGYMFGIFLVYFWYIVGIFWLYLLVYFGCIVWYIILVYFFVYVWCICCHVCL